MEVGIYSSLWLLVKMQNIHLLGASSLTGSSFNYLYKKKYKIISYSRNNNKNVFLDLNDYKTFTNINLDLLYNSFIVSYAPIWVTEKFLYFLSTEKKEKLKKIKGLICCSSSSIITKRFTANIKDKKLVNVLYNSEQKIYEICKKLEINCTIFRPTIIYGECGKVKDNNLYKLSKIIKQIPFIFLPKNVGLRQPIHSFQMAKLTSFFINKMSKNNENNFVFEKIDVGGDEILTYKDMISRLNIKNQKEFIFKTQILTIPDFLFYIIITPLLIIRPNIFEKIFRISSNYSGFYKYCDLTGEEIKKFPYKKYL